MSGYWQCALVCEGGSDEPLAETLQSLMLARRPGDDIAVEVYRPEKAENRSVAAKLAAIAADDVYDLIFVHRDADSTGWEARAEEIRSAGEKRAVPVIPVRMTETWALIFDVLIRPVLLNVHTNYNFFLDHFSIFFYYGVFILYN